MFKKQIISAVLLVGMLLSMMAFAASCSNEEETVTVRVKIVGLNEDVLCDKDVQVTGKDLSVKDSLEQACIDVNLTLAYSSDETKPIQIGDYIDLGNSAEAATEEEAVAEGEGEVSEGEEEAPAEEQPEAAAGGDSGLYYWEYTINGQPATTGSNSQKIAEGDSIVWTWTKFEMTE